jgi:hypothetical protein
MGVGWLGWAVVHHGGLDPVAPDPDGHLDRVAAARPVQDRVGGCLVQSQDQLVGDLGWHLAQGVAGGLPQAGELGWGGGDGQLHGTPLPERRLPSGWFAVRLPLTGPGYREQAGAGDGRSLSDLLVADRRHATARRVPTLHHGQERAQPAGTRMAAAGVVRRLGVPPPRRPMPVGARRADQQQRARQQVGEHGHKQQDEG